MSARPLLAGTALLCLALAAFASSARSQSTAWEILTAAGTSPPPTYGHTAVFDPVGQRMLVTGGDLGTATWELSVAGTPTWSPPSSSSTLPLLRYACSIYDPVRRRFLVFGGLEANSAYSNSVWALPLDGPPEWYRLEPVGPAPTPRLLSTAVYDSHRDRMVIFGGQSSTSYNDTWALSLSGPPTWTQIGASGSVPWRRYGHASVYDPDGQRLVVFGGFNDDNDVYVLPLDSLNGQWKVLEVAGFPPLTPRAYGAAVYEPIDGRMILHGGFPDVSDAWALDLRGAPTWTLLAPSGVPAAPRDLFSAVYDPAHARMIVFGGRGIGDLRALDFPTGEGPPWISGFSPPGGPTGSIVHIHGARLSTVTSVRFRDIEAPFLAEEFGMVRAMVPSGAGVGPISVTNPFGTAVSEASFVNEGPPIVLGFSPPAGNDGTPVRIVGQCLDSVRTIRFNGVEAPILQARWDTLDTVVPPFATTGPITLTNDYATTTASPDFVIANLPLLFRVDPDSGKIDAVVRIHGRYLSQVTRVAFGPESDAPFTLASDTLILATVDSLAVSGPITVTTLVLPVVSPFTFQVLPWDPRPRLLAVRDVPNDQGGRVVLLWEHSDYDSRHVSTVRSYRIWRRAPVQLTPAAAAEAPFASSEDVAADAKVARVGTEFWESIGDVAAARLDGYAYTALTSQDSLPGGNPYTAFFVQAITIPYGPWYTSDVDSGYSVDNLAPPAPTSFVARFTAEGAALHWLPSRAHDVSHYRLHRGASVQFEPGPENLVAATPDTGYFDPIGPFEGVYKLAALDVHGNVGRYAIVSTDDATAASATFLGAEVEGGTVRLRWYLSVDGPLSLSVDRRSDGADWRRLATVTEDGAGHVRYEDAGLEPGRYGYRLGVRAAGGPEEFAGEAWIEIPAESDDLAVRVRNPVTGGDLTVSFAAPAGRSVRLELFDMAGRQVASRVVAGGTGRQTWGLARSTDLPPGVYLVRVGMERPVVARVVVMR